MLRLVCACLLVLSLGPDCLHYHPAVVSANRQQELVELSQRRFQAFFDGDKATYDRLLASDAVFVYSNGRVLDRGQAIAELAPLASPGTFQFRYEDVQFRDLGDSAVLIYRLVFHGPPEIGDYQGVTTDIWALRKGAWQLAALHGTTIPYLERAHVDVDPTLLDEYAGQYANGHFYYDITRQGAQLFGQRNGFDKVPWLAESEFSFYVPSDPSATRIFIRDQKGHVSKLIRIEAAGNSVWTKATAANQK